MLLGIWKNVEELEMWITLEELNAILNAAREKEHNRNRFMAAIQGIDIDKDQKDEVKNRFEKVQQRVQARLQGKSEEQLEYDELGLEVEVEE